MVSTARREEVAQEGFPFQLLPTHGSTWTPAQAKITLNVRLDGRLVPSPASPGGVRLAYSHVVVLDSFFGEPERDVLLCQLTEPGWNPSQGPPEAKWERETADTHTASRTWGLRDHMLRQLEAEPSQAMLEINSRLARLYPEYDIALMPVEHMQSGSLDDHISSKPCKKAESCIGDSECVDSIVEGRSYAPVAQGCHPGVCDAAAAKHTAAAQRSACVAVKGNSHASSLQSADAHADEHQHVQPSQQAHDEHSAGGPDAADAAFCAAFVGNAPVHGDSYCYHVDADPAGLPPSRWTAAFGDYVNGEPGQPLLVSMLLYLDDQWPRDWGAETLFLDGQTDVGVVVRPKRGRAVLMDQDVLHRVSAPSASAKGRPRYSLVWKLAFLPKTPGQRCCLARAEWGVPVSIGSAARVDAVKQSLARKRVRQEQEEATSAGVSAAAAP